VRVGRVLTPACLASLLALGIGLAGLAAAPVAAAGEYLYAADILLEQAAGPTATNVSGELATAPTVQGTEDVIFSAGDPGAAGVPVAS
jgi:hypothetical protein